MADFTIPLKRVIELNGGTVEIVNGVAELTGGNIGLDDYPLQTPAYRSTLNGKIVDHYWNREIGMETPEMFRLAVRRRMNEIMPVYNKLYESLAFEFDPLSTVNMKTVSTGTTDTTANGSNTTAMETENASHSRSVTSDTPQNMLAGNADYATAAADVNGNTTGNTTGNDTSVQSSNVENDGESTTTGYQGIASELLMRWRDAIINVDLSIIRELDDCFMQIWTNGDNYSNTNNSIYLYGRRF